MWTTLSGIDKNKAKRKNSILWVHCLPVLCTKVSGKKGHWIFSCFRLDENESCISCMHICVVVCSGYFHGLIIRKLGKWCFKGPVPSICNPKHNGLLWKRTACSQKKSKNDGDYEEHPGTTGKRIVSRIIKKNIRFKAGPDLPLKRKQIVSFDWIHCMRLPCLKSYIWLGMMDYPKNIDKNSFTHYLE